MDPCVKKKIRKFNFADQMNVTVGVKYLLRGILLFLVHEPSSRFLDLRMVAPTTIVDITF